MDKIADGYYFMFEIGWFIDLLIPTIIRVKDGGLCFVGSKPCDVKGLRPCCIPAGGVKQSHFIIVCKDCGACPEYS